MKAARDPCGRRQRKVIKTVWRTAKKLQRELLWNFSIIVMSDGLVPAVKEWLSYGKLRGLGQWRKAAGKGRFVCKILEERLAEFADILE